MIQPETQIETETETKSECETESKTEKQLEPQLEFNSVSLLMRQTNYTSEECIEKLKILSVEEIIKEYLGITKTEVVNGSTNQNIFKVIRDFF